MKIRGPCGENHRRKSRHWRPKAYIRRCFCCGRQQRGSSCWRERRSTNINPRQRRQNRPGLVNVRGGVSVLQHTFGTRKGGPQEMKLLDAVLKRARVTKHSWLVACDADMSPVHFDKSLLNQMHVIVAEKASTCRSKSAKGETR